MVLDRLIKTMRLGPDDEYEDYDGEYEDIDDGYEDEPAPKKLFAKQEQEKGDYFDEDEPAPKKSTPKITPMKQQPKKGGSGMEVCVIKPTTVEESREITDTLRSNRTVVLNLEGLDVDIAQRIIDFTSGSCYAIDGNLQKISHYIFIITPKSVDISGDFQDIIAGTFEASPIYPEA